MILAIDPGPIESAYVMLDANLRPVIFKKTKNYDVLYICKLWADCFAIEMIASHGMPVGAETFETVFWIGRFWEAAARAENKMKIYRKKDVCMNLCMNMKAKDANIKQALIDRFAPNTSNYGKGSKKQPGWFFGISADMWSAIAVGITYFDIKNRGGIYNG